jgi:predicted component of type VI protein secretion system
MVSAREYRPRIAFPAMLSDDVATSIGAPRLWIVGSDAPRSAPLLPSRTLIGRGDHCDVRLDNELVSWDHAEITRHGSALLVADLDSLNGTLHNGRTLKRPTRLEHGDTLKIGPFSITVELEVRHRGTLAGPSREIELTPDERRVAAALVMHYRAAAGGAGRPATKQEIADTTHLSPRTVRGRLDDLAAKLAVPVDSPHERPRRIAERVLELGLDRE